MRSANLILNRSCLTSKVASPGRNGEESPDAPRAGTLLIQEKSASVRREQSIRKSFLKAETSSGGLAAEDLRCARQP